MSNLYDYYYYGVSIVLIYLGVKFLIFLGVTLTYYFDGVLFGYFYGVFVLINLEFLFILSVVYIWIDSLLVTLWSNFELYFDDYKIIDYSN